MSLKSWKLIMMRHFSPLLPFGEKVSSGFINIDNDWLFLQGKSGDWKMWTLNLIHGPAGVTHRVQDWASWPHAVHSAVVPASHTSTESHCCCWFMLQHPHVSHRRFAGWPASRWFAGWPDVLGTRDPGAEEGTGMLPCASSKVLLAGT